MICGATHQCGNIEVPHEVEQAVVGQHNSTFHYSDQCDDDFLIRYPDARDAPKLYSKLDFQRNRYAVLSLSS